MTPTITLSRVALALLVLGAGACDYDIANPNAPSGTFVSPTKVEELVRHFPGLVLIDEAYVDFADDNCLPLLKDHENIVITRTLSKAYSLAGLRFGFAVARADVIREMNKARDSYPCDAVSVAAATAAIQDQEYAKKTWEHVKSERQRLSSELTQMGWKVLPSEANFILAGVPDGHGKQVYLGLKQQGILVRYFDKPGLNDKIRITVGTSQENNALIGGIPSWLLTLMRHTPSGWTEMAPPDLPAMASTISISARASAARASSAARCASTVEVSPRAIGPVSWKPFSMVRVMSGTSASAGTPASPTRRAATRSSASAADAHSSREGATGWCAPPTRNT